MTRPTFDEILDRCIDEVLGGTATVEDCLARWPEFREELEPLLASVVAIRSLPPVALPAPDPARREAFMAQLRQTPQEPPARRLLPRIAWPSFGLGALSLRLATVAAPAAVVAVVAVALMLARGGSTAAAATLTVFGGGVEQEVGGAWQPVEDGATLAEGTRLRTTATGRALITFGDGSTTTLAPETEVALARLRLDGAREIAIDQVTGRLWNDVETDTVAGSYTVRTPDATVEARGTVFQTVVEADAKQTSVTAVQGRVSVVTGDRRVRLAPGEVTRVSSEQVSEVVAASFSGRMTVEAPVAAALVAEDGAATGTREDGVVMRQIPGIVTREESETGSRQFAFADTPPGVYTLYLTPTTDEPVGEGAQVTLETPSGAFQIPFGRLGGNTARLRVAVEVVEGRTSIRPLDDHVEEAPEAPSVRVVETERSRQQAEAAKERQRERVMRQSALTPTATPTPTPTATPRAERQRDRDRDDDRSQRRGWPSPTPTPQRGWPWSWTPGTPTATPTPEPTPEPTPTATAAAEVPTRANAFRRALETAVETQDDATLRVLIAATGTSNRQLARTRAEVLAEVGRDDAAREAIQRVLTDGSLPGVIERLQDLSGSLSRSDRNRLRDLIDVTPATPTATPISEERRERGRGEERDDQDRRDDRDEREERRDDGRNQRPTFPVLPNLDRFSDLIPEEFRRR